MEHGNTIYDPFEHLYSNPVSAEVRAGFNPIDSRISAAGCHTCTLCGGPIYPGVRYLINATGAKAHAECAR